LIGARAAKKREFLVRRFNSAYAIRNWTKRRRVVAAWVRERAVGAGDDLRRRLINGFGIAPRQRSLA
jgi:hypothetical protein